MNDAVAVQEVDHAHQLSPERHHVLVTKGSLFGDYGLERTVVIEEIPSGAVVHEDTEGLLGVAVPAQLGYILVAQFFEEGHFIPEPICKQVLSSFSLRAGLATVVSKIAFTDDLAHEHLFFFDVPADEQLLGSARIQRNVHDLVSLVDSEEHLVCFGGGGTIRLVDGGLGHLNHYNALEIKTVKGCPLLTPAKNHSLLAESIPFELSSLNHEYFKLRKSVLVNIFLRSF
jgi:hypothetical protein